MAGCAGNKEHLAMLNFTASVSGGQVASEIANDEEEFAELLKGLAGYEAKQFDLMPDYLYDEERGAVILLLRGLADLIEAAE